LRPSAAIVRNFLRVILAAVALLPLCAEVRAGAPADKHQAASAQFGRAEKLREALEARPESDRKLKDYKDAASAYHRVYLITPRAAEVPAALNEVGALYRAMGDLFDESYYQRAVDSYQFLLHEYPANRYREDALLAIAEIERDDLHDSSLAQKNFELFLKLHPHSPHAADARKALDALVADSSSEKDPPGKSAAPIEKLDAQPAVKNAAEKTSPIPTTDTGSRPADFPARDASQPEVTRIRTWNADTYTRIVIDVGADAKYQAARISNPDRIYFDIENAKLDAALRHKPIEVERGGFLKTLRVGQNKSGIVRVVLDVNHVKDYSVFLLPDPYRLVVDVYGTSAAAEAAARATAPLPGPAVAPPTKAPEKSAQKSAPQKVELARNNTPPPPGSVAEKTATDSGPDPVAPHPASAERQPASSRKSVRDPAEELRPPSVPAKMSDGRQSLTRVLGLKIGRIVIDPGHGGHDTGTIGPHGLMEKDICLDVALRLGKLIEQRLPSAEVVYTRDDDTFVPLEQRTEIANDAKADLFLSIHANSSPDHKARGTETYYLNLSGSSDAMAVAARENATSENSVHDLQDLVKKIARDEKIEESRDFATDIQNSLSHRLERFTLGGHNRGVRKAPFVVLIGADMPSVLAEIGFISNPSDEQWLKKPENRERVAEGLYQGVQSYLQSTNSLTLNQQHPDVSGHANPVARMRNPQ